MPIIFAENFANTSGADIMQRYPGSAVNTTALPSFRGFLMDALSPAVYGSVLPRLFLPNMSQLRAASRVELVLGFSAERGIGAASANLIYALGYRLTKAESTATNATIAVMLDTGVVSSTITIPNSGDWTNLRRLHIIAEADGAVWQYRVYSDTGIKFSFTEGKPQWWNGIRPNTGSLGTHMPRGITSIIVATDTPPNTRLQPTWDTPALSVVDAASWTPSATTILGDTDKTEGQTATPFISAQDAATLELGTNAAPTTFVANTVSGKAEQMQYLDVTAGGQTKTYMLSPTQSAVPHTFGNSSIVARVREPALPVISQSDFDSLTVGTRVFRYPDKIANSRLIPYSDSNESTRTYVVEAGPFPGSNSLRFTAGSYGRLPIAGTETTFGTRPFTIEMWISFQGAQYIFGKMQNTTTLMQFALQATNSTTITSYLAGAAGVAHTVPNYATNMLAIALTFDGTNCHVYLGGTRVRTAAQGPFQSPAPLTLFGYDTGNYATNASFSGRVANVRVIDGACLYSGASYTLATEPFPAP